MTEITRWIQHFSFARDSKTLLELGNNALTELSNANYVVIHISESELNLTTQQPLVQNSKLINVAMHRNELLQLPGYAEPASLPFVAISSSCSNSLTALFYLFYEKAPSSSNSLTQQQSDAITIISETFLLAWQSIAIQEQLSRQLAEKSAELLEIQQQSEQALRIKNRFLSATSHDLRQPLQQIHNLTAMLKKQIHQPESLKLLSRLTHVIEDMDDVMKTLLNLDRLTQGIIQPEMTNFLITDLFDVLKSDFQQIASDNHLSLEFDVLKTQVYSDKKLLLQILRNLLSNAIKYTPKGTIGIRLQRQDKHLQLSVFDTGPGILAGQQKMIFDPFYQLDSDSDSNGFGLGLSIVKALCETLRIPVSIHSEPGLGTEFRLTLVRSQSDFEPTSEASEQLIQTQPTATYKILYLEDDPVLLESMELLLQMADFNTLSASNLEQALMRVEQQAFQPDLILTDKKLSQNQDGIQAVKQIRRHFDSNIPAILLTGYTESRITNEALQDVQRVLTKPIDIDLLTCEIKQLLS